MSDAFVAEIRIFPFNFAPTGWASCDGQILPISQNTALFSLLGTTYGGNGQTTFALPDMQGNAAMQPGQGQGLTERFLGEMSGADFITLLTSEMPAHTHNVACNTNNGVLLGPNPAAVPGRAQNGAPYNTAISPLVPMAFQELAPAGGSLPHNNMQPYLTLNYCIALQGIFPPRQ